MKLLTRILFMAAVTLSLIAADKEGAFDVGGFQFTKPKDWKSLPSSGMRKAQLQIPAEQGKTGGDVVFFEFPAGVGGGAKANIDRWLGQFQEPREQLNEKIENKKVGDTSLTYVQAQGTYLSGMPGGPKTPLPNHVLLGAIIEGANANVFVRLTAPKEMLAKVRPEFEKMIEAGLKK